MMLNVRHNGIITNENVVPPAMLQTSRGLAHRHRRSAMRKYSNLTLHTKKDIERFWSKVDTSGSCWEWLAAKNVSGHGQLKLRGYMHYAHRIAFVSVYGEIQTGLDVHHECNNPGCVNPSHMALLTKSEHAKLSEINVRRRAATHCKWGHEFTDGNTYLWRGSRHCRECKRIRDRKKGRATK